MSDCEKFKELAERFAFGECTESEEKILKAHTDGCKKCKEELAFALNIKNTLSSLPEIDVPDNFLTSLNERLDAELISPKKPTSPVIYISLFRTLKRSSALAACLILTVTLSTGVYDKLSYNGDLVISDTVSIAELGETSVPAETSDAQHNAADEALSNPQMPVPQNNENTLPASSETPAFDETKPVSDVKTKTDAAVQKENTQNPKNVRQKTGSNPEKKSVPKMNSKTLARENTPENVVSSADIGAEVQTENTPMAPSPAPAETQRPTGTSSMPDYMDDKDNIVTEQPQKSVKLDDFDIKETDALLESFSLVKIPENKAIVASPTVVESVKRAKIDIDPTEQPIMSANYGAGGGSLFVSPEDGESVTTILNKYAKNGSDNMCMISTENYKAFINELNDNGISYRDYMISTGGANVCFKLIVA